MPEETGIQCHGWDGPCESKNATRARMRTRYADDKENWATLCPECWNVCAAYWDERWAEYYAQCM